MLRLLCNILMASGIPADILTEVGFLQQSDESKIVNVVVQLV